MIRRLALLAALGTAWGACGGTPDPLAPRPDRTAGLVNVTADPDALLEHGALTDACDRWRAGQRDRRTTLLCGKRMFFYETFGTGGIPKPLVVGLQQALPNEIGPGWEQLGLVRDPSSADALPFGLAPTKPVGQVEQVAFTCASCHFGRLPDGRLAVGAPNHRYDYGRMILAIAVVPTLGLGFGKPADHDPLAVAAVQPMIDRLAGDAAARATLIAALQTIVDGGGASMAPAITPADEHAYASWPIGGQDFVIAPLPLDDGVVTVSKIIGLWGIPDADEQQRAGMPHAMLAWTGVAQSLESFLDGFVVIGGGDRATWTTEALSPLAEYVRSLDAPPNPTPPDPALVRDGRARFASDCLGCHDGPRGSGRRLYGFDEVGTDDAMRYWMDPDGDGQPCCGVTFPPGQALTGKVKSPRLGGLWAQGRFLHDASVSSLEALLCMDGPRPTETTPAMGDQGHLYGCELGDREKQALLAYLRQ